MEWAHQHPEVLRERQRRYGLARKDDKKVKARKKLKDAVYAGKVKKFPCVICGDKKVHGHHPDYDYPFYVVWLCRKHHIALHRGKLG